MTEKKTPFTIVFNNYILIPAPKYKRINQHNNYNKQIKKHFPKPLYM